MPNVVHISYSSSGGAGIAASQLSETIQEHSTWTSGVINLHARNLWEDPLADWTAAVTAGVDEFVIKKPGARAMLSLMRTSSVSSTFLIRAIHEADIVHLHWVEGMLHGGLLKALLSKKPGSVFWTLHDMRPFTGGCHFAGECRQFENGCNTCPIVRDIFQGSVAQSMTKRHELIRALQPNFIAPGNWIRKVFLGSPIGKLPCHVIPNALSDSCFVIGAKASEVNNLRLGFVAANLSDPRKGLDKARGHVGRLLSSGLEIEFQLVGSAPPKNLSQWENYMGFLSPSEITDWMANLDFLVFTSVSDNAPMVVAQSLAAGTPVLIAAGTGADEMVTLGEDSLDLDHLNVSDLMLEKSNRTLSQKARMLSAKYCGQVVAREIVSLYERAVRF